MLGPEQLNFAPKTTPVLLDNAAAVRVSEQVAKGMGLRDNQIVRGIIEDRGGLLKLVLNNREFDWKASKRFSSGDQIDFRYQKTANGRVLQPLAHAPAPTLQSSILYQSAGLESHRIMGLLYRPEQASSMAKFFAPSILGRLLSEAKAIPANIRLDQLVYMLSKISPEMVRSALVNSGLFTEYALGHQLPVRSDLKQILRSLLRNNSLQKSESELINSAVDEIESRQLEGLIAQQNKEVSYHFVIPFFDADPVEIHFERGRATSLQDEDDWVINLHTKSSDLGEIWSKSTIKASSEIEMIFWAIDEKVVQLAGLGRTKLADLLNEFGLSLTKFSALNAPRPNLDPTLSGPGQVLDVTT